MRLRGELCLGLASFLSITSVVILIFIHVGQISTSTVPRNISLLKVNMSAYSSVLETFIRNPVSGLYTSTANATLGQQAGLRQYYEFGLYSYCGFVSATNATSPPPSSFVNSTSTPKPSIGPGDGICSTTTFSLPFTPYDYVKSDMLSNYSILSDNFIPDTTFRDSKYLGDTSRAAYWMLLLGTISAAAAIISGIAKNHLTFFLSAIFSLFSSILLLIAASTYTILVKKCEAINSILLTITDTNQKIPVGIIVNGGIAIYLMWGSCVCMILSVVPYFMSCCSWRG